MKTPKKIRGKFGSPHNTRSTIEFSQNLYTQESIQSAVVKFKDFGKIKVFPRGKYYQVKMQDIDSAEGPERLINEFKNYVLYLTITHAKN